MTKAQSLKKLRKASGMSRETLAAIAGINWITIYRAEKKNRWPINPSVRKALEAALGIKS